MKESASTPVAMLSVAEVCTSSEETRNNTKTTLTFWFQLGQQ
jgi:hypothetical protein